LERLRERTRRADALWERAPGSAHARPPRLPADNSVVSIICDSFYRRLAAKTTAPCRAALSIWWALRTSPCRGPNPSVDRRVRWMRRAPSWQGALRTSVSCLPVNAALRDSSAKSEKWRQSEICIVINNKSQGSIAKHRRSDESLYYTFIIQSASERIFKIGEHLAKLQAKWLIVSCAPFPLHFCPQKRRSRQIS